MFARFIDPERFPKTAFFNIGFTYFYSFMSIGLLAVDLGFSKKNESEENLEKQNSVSTVMSVLWNFVYWGSLVHGSLLG